MAILRRKKVWITAITLLAVNLLLKMIYLDSASIAWDEPFTIYHAQMPAGSIIRHLFNGNNPPGFELILHYWIRIFGTGPFAVRFLPCLFSSLTAVMVFLLGNRAFSFRTGLIAALIFTFSNFHLFFAHEARVYALFGLLTVTSLYLFIAMAQTGQKRYLAALALVNGMILYCHYFGFFVLAIEGFSVLVVTALRRQHFVRFAISAAASLLLFLPNIITLAGRFSDSASNGTWIKKPDGIVSLYNMLWSFSGQPLTTVVCMALLMAALVKLMVRKDLRNGSTASKIVVIWFLFPFFFMFFISWIIPVFLDRYLVFVSFGYYFLVVLSTDYLFEKRYLKYGAFTVLAGLFAATFRPDLDNKRHVIETVNKVRELKDEQTTVIICDHDFVLNFAYYYDPELFADVDDQTVYGRMKASLEKENIYAIYSITPDLPLKRKVIFLDAAADFSNPDNHILETLQSGYELRSVHHFETVFNVYEFERRE